MRLELDAGNTRIKWRLLDANEDVELRGVDLRNEIGQVDRKSIDEVWVSSVHPEQNDWISKCFPQAKFATTDSAKQGLSNSYADPSRMGVDRWLAMLGAYKCAKDQSHIIVDAGTALTIDVIVNHHHVGGYICPGLRTMKDAVFGKTQQVLADDDWLADRSPGNSTQACLDHGILDMVCAWIEKQVTEYPEATVWLTGGDSDALLTVLNTTGGGLLNRSLVLEGDLVLNGLKVHFLN